MLEGLSIEDLLKRVERLEKYLALPYTQEGADFMPGQMRTAYESSLRELARGNKTPLGEYMKRYGRAPNVEGQDG